MLNRYATFVDCMCEYRDALQQNNVIAMYIAYNHVYDENERLSEDEDRSSFCLRDYFENFASYDFTTQFARLQDDIDYEFTNQLDNYDASIYLNSFHFNEMIKERI